MKVLVTGGAGFIGSHLCEQLIAGGYDVVVLDNLSFGRREWVPKGVRLIEGDITNLEACKAAADGVQGIFHCAAMSRSSPSNDVIEVCTASNVVGTQNILMAARHHHVRRVVYSGSSTYYGSSPAPHREDGPSHFLNLYGLTKHVGEQYCKMLCSLYGIEYNILRYFSVYGPRQPGSGPYALVIGIFLESLKNNRPLIIHGTGAQRRDFIHVRDVARANIAALESPQSGEIFNVGSGSNISIRDLADLISPKQEFGPTRPADSEANSRRHQPDYLQARLAPDDLVVGRHCGNETFSDPRIRMTERLDFGRGIAPDDGSSALKSLTGRAEFYAVWLLLVFVGGIAVIGYVGEKEALLGALAQLNTLLIGQILLLSLTNYTLRSFRFYWLGRRQLGLDISPPRMMSYYIAGFAMSATPGKVGQALSSWFLKRLHGYPYRLTLPLVFSDRMTDVLASAMLCLIGLQALPYHGVFVFVGLGALGISCRLLARPGPLLQLIAIGYGLIGRKGRLFGALRGMLRKTALLLTPWLPFVFTIASDNCLVCRRGGAVSLPAGVLGRHQPLGCGGIVLVRQPRRRSDPPSRRPGQH